MDKFICPNCNGQYEADLSRIPWKKSNTNLPCGYGKADAERQV